MNALKNDINLHNDGLRGSGFTGKTKELAITNTSKEDNIIAEKIKKEVKADAYLQADTGREEPVMHIFAEINDKFNLLMHW